ncbi:unnamed protein product [Lampetra planeri]
MNAGRRRESRGTSASLREYVARSDAARRRSSARPTGHAAAPHRSGGRRRACRPRNARRHSLARDINGPAPAREARNVHRRPKLKYGVPIQRRRAAAGETSPRSSQRELLDDAAGATG